jgi:hypothetical protein
VSSTLDRVDWNAELVRGDLGKAVQQLKRESGKGLFVGGVKLPQALAELGLIDEYEFVVQPRLAGLFFRVNTSRSPAELPALASAVDTRLPAAEEPELRQDFARLIARTLRRIFPGVTIPEVATLEEITMVGQHMFEWTQRQLKEARTEGKKEGLQAGERKGRRAGRQQGELEGARRILLDLLKLRFGALTPPVRQRVKSIQSATELRALAGKVLIASSLAEMGLAEGPVKPSAR